MRQTIEDLALVLRHVSYGEHDVIVDLLTQGHGRISVFARGARKSNRRFVGGLGPFTLLRVEVRLGREDALGTLSTSEALRFFEGLVSDPLRLACASHWMALMAAVTPAGAGADPVFSHVLSVLQWMNDGARSPSLLAFGLLRAELVYLQDAGVLVSVAYCQRTGATIDSLAEAVFLAEEGIVSTPTAMEAHGALVLDRAALDLLQRLMTRQWSDTITPAALNTVRHMFFQVWALVLDRPPKTWAAWDEAIRDALSGA